MRCQYSGWGDNPNLRTIRYLGSWTDYSLLFINRGVGGCVVVPGGVLGGIRAGPRGLFSAMLAVAIVLMMVC